MRPTLYIIDISNIIHRAFHVHKDLSTSYNFPTGAIWGTTHMLLRFIARRQPTHMLVCYDSQSGKSLRKDIYPQYKANRVQVNDVSAEEKIIRRIIEMLGIKSVECDGYEADDLIGTAVEQLSKDFKIVVVTGDKDLMQLVSDEDGVTMLDTMKNIEYQDADVVDKFGVRPDQIVDYLALVGDASDNVPGVRGIGPKSAVELLKKHASVGGIYSNMKDISPKLQAKLIPGEESAILSKQLVQLYEFAPVSLNNEDVVYKPTPNSKIFDLFDRLEFKNIRYDVELMWQAYK